MQELPLLRSQEGLRQQQHHALPVARSQPLPPQAVVVDALCVAVVDALRQ